MTFNELRVALRDKIIATSGESAESEARRIIYYSAKIKPERLPVIASEIAPREMCDAALELADRRAEGEPLEYIFGCADFFGLELEVDKNCLIPRTDTEVLCEAALSFLPPEADTRVCDICSGSGCIAAALAYSRPKLKCDCFEISAGAIKASKRNFAKYSLENRVNVYYTDVLNDNFLLCDEYDVIASNPPYLTAEDMKKIPREVQAEPKTALLGGDDGLVFYRRLLKICPSHIKHGGKLLFEIGAEQGKALEGLCAEAGLSCEIKKDYAGNDRVCIINIA